MLQCRNVATVDEAIPGSKKCVSATKPQEDLFSQEVSDPLGVSSPSRSRKCRGRLLEA